MGNTSQEVATQSAPFTFECQSCLILPSRLRTPQHIPFCSIKEIAVTPIQGLSFVKRPLGRPSSGWGGLQIRTKLYLQRWWLGHEPYDESHLTVGAVQDQIKVLTVCPNFYAL